MHKKLFQFLIQLSGFKKFIFLFYYSHIITNTITNLKLIKESENNSHVLLNDDKLSEQIDNYLLNYCSTPEVTKSVIAHLEENFAFIPEYELPLKIMPLGDSITYGVIGTNDRDSGGYRTELWNKFVADGLKVEFVGSQSSGPDSLVSKNHEGHCGWTIGQIAFFINEWLQTYQPQLILLTIGTNNTRKNSLKTMIENLSALIDKITTQLPNTHLLVSSIPPIHPAAKPLRRGIRAIYFNAAIPMIIELKIAQGKKVHFVDMNNLTLQDLTASLSLDLDNGLHPNIQGYRKIANVWHNAVLKVINSRKTKVIQYKCG